MEDAHRSALLTDLYQLTMAYAAWRTQRADREAVFTMSFRTSPFAGGYAIACGLAPLLGYLEAFRFSSDDTSYLSTLIGADGRPLFDEPFLDYLGRLRLQCDIDAVPEGTAVFPHEPLVRVRGPLLSAQLIETALLNLINFDTLIATKAARICQAAHGQEVIEFGLRRAQGVDGALAASRAAFIGGCHGTSNVLAGRRYGIPVRGTHAHSWVMAFGDELEAFRTYARALPHHCAFLVDTYDTLAGVRHAITVGEELRAQGHRLLGIRLDSGDLAWLSIEARRLLDAAGFPETTIIASNDLDERLIESLRAQGARITVWGVGTRLVTGHDQGALGGVYKLSALRQADGHWRPCIKLSEQAAKISIPGALQVRRFRRGGEYVGDCIYDELTGLPADPVMVDPFDATRRRRLEAGTEAEDLLVPVMRAGSSVYRPPPPAQARERTLAQLAQLHPGIRRFDHPHQYPVGLEAQLYEQRQQLILAARPPVPLAGHP